MAQNASSPGRGIRKSLIGPNLLSFILLAVFVLLAYLLQDVLQPVLKGSWLVLAGTLMALIPAAVWLFFFYRQDRKEPEPKGMVLQVFVLGGLLAAAIGQPLLKDFFQVSNWLDISLVSALIGGVLVVGFSQEFLKYAAVRFTVYNSHEFDEHTDGIIYATAAGLGFATVLNIAFVVDSGGVNLGMGAIRVTLTALAHASFAGITGYFLSREKLDGRPNWWMPLGLSLAALLNGIFYTVWGSVTRANITSSGGYVNPWIGLILAVVLAIAVMGCLSWLIQRDQQRHPKEVA